MSNADRSTINVILLFRVLVCCSSSTISRVDADEHFVDRWSSPHASFVVSLWSSKVKWRSVNCSHFSQMKIEWNDSSHTYTKEWYIRWHRRKEQSLPDFMAEDAHECTCWWNTPMSPKFYGMTVVTVDTDSCKNFLLPFLRDRGKIRSYPEWKDLPALDDMFGQSVFEEKIGRWTIEK